MFRRAVLFAAVAASIVVASPAQAARYATYHIHNVSLTPYAVHVTQSVCDYCAASAGKKFLLVQFHMVNRDDVQEEVTYNDLKITIPSGQVIEQSFESPTAKLIGIVLDPGGKLDGGIAWEVPNGVHQAVIKWNPSAGFSDAKMPTYSWVVKF